MAFLLFDGAMIQRPTDESSHGQELAISGGVFRARGIPILTGNSFPAINEIAENCGALRQRSGRSNH
jgi:hypothetical protein